MSAVAHIDEYKTGRFYTDEYRGSLSWNGYENNVLLRNDGNHAGDGVPRFVDVGMALGADDVYDSRGVAVADYDNDGDLDILVNHSQGDNARDADGVPPVLLRNDLGASRGFLAVDLVGTTSPRQPAGALVRIETADGVTQTRMLDVGSAYASQQSDRLYFGLNEHTRVERLEVIWPGGGTEVFEGIEGRGLVRIVEGRSFERLELPASPRSPARSASMPATP